MTGEEETLTDGVVTLRPYAETHVAAHVEGEDDETRMWFGQPGPSTYDGMLEVVDRGRREREAGTRLTFAIEHDGSTVAVASRPDRSRKWSSSSS